MYIGVLHLTDVSQYADLIELDIKTNGNVSGPNVKCFEMQISLVVLRRRKKVLVYFNVSKRKDPMCLETPPCTHSNCIKDILSPNTRET